MKKTVFCLLAAAGAALISACASTPVKLSENSPVAIVTVCSVPTLPWHSDDEAEEEDNESGLLGGLVGSFLKNPDIEVSSSGSRVDKAEELIRSILVSSGGVQVIDSETVQKTAIYQKTKESVIYPWFGNAKPEGYKIFDYSASKLARMIMEQSGAKSALYVKFKFERVLAKGNRTHGQLTAGVVVQPVLLNSRGAILYRDKFFMQGTESIPIENDKYDKEALVNMYDALTEAAVNRFVFALQK